MKQFADVLPKDNPGYAPKRVAKLQIDLQPGTEPISQPVYKLSPADLDELKAQLRLLLEKGLMRASISPWGAPFLFFKKRDGGLLMCLGFRVLNKATIENRSPIPRSDEMFDRLSPAKHFTALNIRSGYFQIRVRNEDIAKTGIRTRYGPYEVLGMLFGLTNASSYFPAMMNGIFTDFVDDFMLTYLDDILIFSSDEKQHLKHVDQMLERLRKHTSYMLR